MRYTEIVEDPTQLASNDEIKAALKQLQTLMSSKTYGYTDMQPISDESGRLSFDVRYWGDWEIPDDAEDDGDYDWKILSSDSSNLLKSMVDKVQAEYPNVKLEVSCEEKEWIFVSAVSKL